MSNSTINASNQFWWLKSYGIWSDMRNATTANSAGGDNTECQVWLQRDTGDAYHIGRAGATFDTSSIPSNATITTATLYWYRKYEHVGLDSTSTIYVCPLSDTGSGASYYNQTYFGSQVGSFSPITSGEQTVNAWVSIALAVSAITKAGTTKLGFRSYHDYQNSAPSNSNERNQIESDILSGNECYLYLVWTTPPAVTSGVVSNLTPQYATISGEVTDVGGGTVTERGICWSKTSNPTISDSKNSSSGQAGSFSVLASNLIPGTKYYYRAYVTTENSTTYGDNLTFVTPSGALIFMMM